MTNTPPQARPVAYNTARRADLSEPSFLDDMRRDLDLAEERGDEHLLLWAKAWGSAFRESVINRDLV